MTILPFDYHFYSVAIVVHYIDILYSSWPIRVKTLVEDKGVNLSKGLQVFSVCIIISVDFNDEQYSGARY